MQSYSDMLTGILLGSFILCSKTGELKNLTIQEIYTALFLGGLTCQAIAMTFRSLRTRGTFSAVMVVITVLLACLGFLFGQVNSPNVGLAGAAFAFCCNLGYTTIFGDSDDPAADHRMKILIKLLKVQLGFVMFFLVIGTGYFRYILCCNVHSLVFLSLWQLAGTMSFQKSAKAWKLKNPFLPCLLYCVVFMLPFLAFLFIAPAILPLKH